VSSEKHTGTVKFFSHDRGFGFITPHQGGNDVFVHISNVGRSGLREINELDQVEFSIEPDKKNGKPTATNLRLL
jgi:CspA family cold shock protein